MACLLVSPEAASAILLLETEAAAPMERSRAADVKVPHGWGIVDDIVLEGSTVAQASVALAHAVAVVIRPSVSDQR